MLPSTYDKLYTFIFDDLEIKGEIVQLHDVYNELFKNKNFPRSIEKLLCQLVLVSNLLSVNLKQKADITVEIRGVGLLKYAVINSDHKLNFRGTANHSISDPTIDYSFKELVGENSILLITVCPDKGEPYQGIVEVTGYNLSDTLENYFLRSQQINTKIMLEIDINSKEKFGAGLLVQSLPNDDPEHEDDFNTVNHLVNTLTKKELLELETDEILFRLFNQFQVRLFDAKPVNFKCLCSREKCINTLKTLGKEDVLGAFNSNNQDGNKIFSMKCSQCGVEYIFNEDDVRDIFD